MIVLDISCDICRTSEVFSYGTPKKIVRKVYHHIKRKDICCSCATIGVIGIGYIPSGTEVIRKNLTISEKKKIIQYYNL